MKWYDWGTTRSQLVTFGKAIQGVSPYKVIIEPDPRRCETGWCNYGKRQIAVNPTLFPDLPAADQYRLTQAILVHEVGHRRFTTPSTLGPVVHTVFNILEDERIERLMSQYFAGLGHLLVILSAQMLRELPELNPKSNSPDEVLNFMLKLRWSERTGTEVVTKVSTINTKRWNEVEPLVRKSWMAQTSIEVEKTAIHVAAILDLKELPEWLTNLLSKLGSLEGKRLEDDQAEEGRNPIVPNNLPQEENGNDPDFDGTPLPNEHPAGNDFQDVKPAPYLDIVAQVQPQVEELAALLGVKPKSSEQESSPRGQRFSVREWLHQPTTPFTVEEDAPKEPPTLAFRVLIDHSTSMNHGERMRQARIGAMLLHLVGVRLSITHEIALTPNDLRIANLTSGERGLALIAGIAGQTSYEGVETTLAAHAEELLATKADIRMILVIHDGYPDSPNQIKALCQTLRGKVEVIGLGLDYDRWMVHAMKDLFGPDRLILCRTPEELTKKLGTILKVIYGK